MECKKKRISQDTHIAVDDIKKKKIVSLDDVTSEEVYTEFFYTYSVVIA